jgi:hypothetical protein
MAAAKKIEEGMNFDVWREAWFDLCRERGHTLQTDPDFGGVNQFVTSGGFCNGPGCTECGWSACMHCDWKGARIPKCTAEKKRR